MTVISKAFDFEAAHVLPWHKGQCSRLHGHSYKLEVDLEGELNENGIVADFSDLKQVVKEQIVDTYDHRLLNDYFENPTAEVLANAFLLKLREAYKGNGTIKTVRLWETANSWVTAS